jgi:hypothetical protein
LTEGGIETGDDVAPQPRQAAKVEKIALGEFEHRLRVAKQEARGADVFSLGSSDPR